MLAFVRWRGNRAALLTTVYDQGHSRQVQLANLGEGYAIAPEVRDTLATRFPGIPVDWDAVERALAEGPPVQGAASVPNERVQWLEAEQQLRRWATRAEPHHHQHAARLRAAADVLALWRAGRTSPWRRPSRARTPTARPPTWLPAPPSDDQPGAAPRPGWAAGGHGARTAAKASLPAPSLTSDDRGPEPISRRSAP